MASARSIGSLYINLEARTAKMEADLERAKTQIKNFTKETNDGTQNGAKSVNVLGAAIKLTGEDMAVLGAGAALATAGIAALALTAKDLNEIPSVNDNFKKGIDEAAFGFYKLKKGMESFIADQSGEFIQKGVEAAVYGFFRLKDGAEAADVALEKFREDAEKYANLDFERKLASINEQMLSLKGTRGSTIDTLREEADALRMLKDGIEIPDEVLDRHPQLEQLAEEIALRGGLSRAMEHNLDILAAESDLMAARREQDMRKTLSMASLAYEKTLPGGGVKVIRGDQDPKDDYTGMVGTAAKNLGLDKQLKFYREEMTKLNAKLGTDLQDMWNGSSVAIERATRDYALMAEAQKHINELVVKLKSPAEEMQKAFKSGFEQLDGYLLDFVKKGKFRLDDFVGGIADSITQMFFKLAIVNPLQNMLFSGASSWTALPSLFGGGAAIPGHADGGAINGLSWVGEKGPELFVPPSGGGTIIPNHALSGGGGAQYFIDARGADAAQIAILQAQVASLHGSVERRAVAAVVQAKRRSGSLARALNQ